MSETRFVALSTQKGGAGKTTLTVLTASYLHYVRGIDVAVIDCDFPQYSIDEMRKRDLKNMEESVDFRRLTYDQFKRTSRKAYPVMVCRPDKAIAKANELLEMPMPPKVIFFDLPGTMNNPGVVNTLANMDYIFCPIIADRVVMQSSLAFAQVINDRFITTGKTNIKGMYFVWNMVDGREKTNLYDAYEQLIAEMGLSSLDTSVPDSKRFRREGARDDSRPLFRSTVLPPDRTLIKGSNIKELTDEILGIIKI